ncbi:PspC domain-containing protein [Streptomyces carpaticus]|uniref:PspC domain-containing protein n=1 Tax=Streptomyces carpaticus TaxID=285558 RepID=A0ABV4ZRB9_9ACTN
MSVDESAPPAPVTARLTRSRRQKVVGGVCGGLGRYFHLDPVLFRVPLAVLSVIGGLGLIAYGVAWLLIPFEGEEENEGRRLLSGRVEGPGLTALLFTLVGCGLYVASVSTRHPAIWFSVLLVTAVGGAAYWSRRRALAGEDEPSPGGTGAAEAAATAAPPEAQAPPAPAVASWWRESAGSGTNGTTGGGAMGVQGQQGHYLWGPADTAPGPRAPYAGATATGPVYLGKTAGPWAAPPPGTPGAVRPLPPPRRGAWLGGLVFLAAVVSGLVVMAATWLRYPLGTVLVCTFAVVLAVYGAGWLMSAFFGRLGAGSVVVVVLTTLALAGASVLPRNITTSWTDSTWEPVAAEQVQDRYELGTGRGQLDLSGLALTGDETVRTTVEAGAGQIKVIVPWNAEVIVHTSITAGAYTYNEAPEYDSSGGPDHVWGGIRNDQTDTYPPPGGVEAAGTVELTLDMGIGHVEVVRWDRVEPAPEAEIGS